MKIKASGRSALILAAGLWVCFAGPSQAAADADSPDYPAASSKPENAAGAPMALSKYIKHGARHGKRYAHRKSGRVALNSADDKKPSAFDVAADERDNSTAASVIPPSVANAHAQLAAADTPTANAMSARANNLLQTAPDDSTNTQPAADSQVVSADQLNEVDRALHETRPPQPALTVASAEAPAAPSADTPAASPAPPAMASSNESSTWDQTSLIGKIFIGFGALLTMASAARMFMA
jgi:hypothetical protein